uniref:Tetratricopeptide repeat protein 29 n=1 Tax=Calcidiscus leptoporus TaxID=127549 RepID=A0A7S0J6Y6_9EUKA
MDEPDKQTLCVDILVSGHVQAYVDFFYLTHRPDVQSVEAGEEGESEASGMPADKLPIVKTQLSEAEVARRRGDTKAVYACYSTLAALFCELGDQRTTVYFWEKCSEIARLTADAEGETAAIRALGIAHEALHDVTTAISYYEKLLNLATTSGLEKTERLASTHLFTAYNLVSADAESKGDLEQALEHREKSLKSAAASGEPAMLSKAHFALGQAHEKLKEMAHLHEAVANYKPYLTLCEQADDAEGQGAACFALARTYQRLEDGKASQEYLQRFLQLAESSGKPADQADACCALGVLYNQQGDYPSAVEFLERFFELARSLGDRAMLDKVRETVR